MSRLTNLIQAFWEQVKMSLTDIDKQNSDRSNPVLNTEDNVVNRMAHKTLATTYKTVGNQDANRLVFDKGSIRGYDESDNNSILMGYDPDISSRPVVRIAKEGYDQSTATNDQLIFNSEQNVLKVALSGTATVNVTSVGVTASISIDHGLGSPPIVVAAVADPSTPTAKITVPYMYFSDATHFIIADITMDSTRVYFRISTGSGMGAGTLGDWVFKYYILQESAS